MRASLHVAFAFALCACSHAPPTSDADAGSCPNDLPAACPTPTPSYQNDIVDIVESHCASCHGPGGTAAEKPLLTYDDVFRQRSAVLNQVYGCAMPPSDQRPMTPQQRAKMLAWLVCGAPNN